MSASLTRAGAFARRTERLPWLRSTPWWICFLSFSSLGFTQAAIKFTSAGGTLAPALFLALWLGMAAGRPRTSLDWMLGNRLVYALPLLAISSTFWSADPSHSLRAGMEFLVTLLVATYSARALPVGMFVSACMTSWLVQVISSLASGVHQEMVYAGSEALSGLFGSKNYMGYMSGLLGLMSLATLADRSQAWLLRAAAAAGLLLGIMVLIQARSSDAILGFGMGLVPLCYVVLLSALPPRTRIILNSGAALIGLAAAAIVYTLRAELFDLVLAATGKDAGLTGRDYLWDHARQFMELRPLRGLGYGAFWVQGNPDAEGLWRHFQIDQRGGFSFHNMYYQVSVDLGVIGAVVWLGVFTIVLVGIASAALRRPSPPLAFFLAFMVFTGIRLSVETELLGPFDVGPIFMACAWVYATRPARAIGAPR